VVQTGGKLATVDVGARAPGLMLLTPLALTGVGAYCLYKASARKAVVKGFFAKS